MSTNDNRKVGTSFERLLCLILSDRGFWAHNLAQNKQGQPFDVIAARNGKTYPIDCKVCEKDLFRLSRVEENQYSAMSLWRHTGNGTGWFALKLANEEVWFLSFEDIEKVMVQQHTLYRSEIMSLGVPFAEWVQLCE